ncbi:glycoside hydrolase family 28 protein [Enterococcus sp. RIT-PI-f]|uniref:glycoside hydrolase family 28 protein n=1 Tax=Enterococcus sp. RIT-PI-f TaxID=1690244 RepID=UPI0006B88059|nr:glycosyl hydrolase family 28 protein [Enterococcus sp. RIT-PI-f]KPG73774.1 glycoside hydrolase [Enterococcus sp. RIT-PI-f]
MKDITKQLQEQIDQASLTNGQVITPAGEYLVGAIFIKSHVHFVLSAETTLYGSWKIDDYPEFYNRVAGVDMHWPAAVLNIVNATNVSISGTGKIDGQGEHWWRKFWGDDETSGMMADYAKKGLRWAADYDCKRPRNILVYRSQGVKIKGIRTEQSGFWNTQVTYANDVLIDGISVINSKGPSTDGIDIDSSENVVVQNVYVSCNDDNICIKAGRGEEARENQTISRNITIKDCQIGKGSGITIGSETSGGIEDVDIRRIQFEGTGVGFRIKSANDRGGFIQRINVSELHMKNVQFPFLIQTDWYPEYSYAMIPHTYRGDIPDHWHKLIGTHKQSVGPAKVKDIVVGQVAVVNDQKMGSSRAFFIEGSEKEPIDQLQFKDVRIEAHEYGKISGVKQMDFQHVTVTALNITKDENDVYER